MYYDNQSPPCPAVTVRIIGETKVGKFVYNLDCGPFDALVDTGSDITCVPESAIGDDPVLYQWLDVQYGDGPEEPGKFIIIDTAIVEFLDKNGRVLLTGKYSDLMFHVVSEGLLGRDILKEHVCNLDGPNSICLIK